MKISLVAGTINRTDILEGLLLSLADQTYKNFHLLVVDQNSDDRLVLLLERFRNQIDIVHLRSIPGLSRARNIGLKHCSGELVGFPDDDCWYPPDLLERIVAWFSSHASLHGLAGCSQDGADNFSNGRWSRRPGNIGRYSLWNRAISYTIFIRREVCDRVGEFDERLGVGAGTELGSGEESDYLCRALACEFRLFYNPEFVVYHKDALTDFNENTWQRAYLYGSGYTYVLKKHGYPTAYLMLAVVRPLVGFLLGILSCRLLKARYHWRVFEGRLNGLKLSKE